MVFRGDLAGLQEWIISDSTHQKGEFVIMVAGYEKEEDSDENYASMEQLLTVLIEELPIKQAANLAAKITGQKKNALYRQAMALKKES